MIAHGLRDVVVTAVARLGVKPVPPILYGIAAHSADHNPEKYRRIILPALAALQPAPRVRLVCYQAGIHNYSQPEPELPFGIGAAAAHVWAEAIEGGYYLPAAG